MKDIMVVAQIASSTDAARVNVGVADSDSNGGSFEAAFTGVFASAGSSGACSP